MTRLAPALGLAIILALSAPAQALPEDPGPAPYKVHTISATIAGKKVTFDLYVPAVSKPAPLVVVCHGFARARANMAGWGKLLASRGYVAAAPSLPGLMPDHKLNGRIVSGLLAWMAAQGSVTGSPLKGLVDSARRAVVGHSAGGLASLLAASEDNTIDLVVGLDPVGSGGLGKAAAARIRAPTLFVLAEPSACNASGNATEIHKALAGPRLMLRVLKANHCDPESPSDGMCALTCGGAADPGRHKLFRRYAMAVLDHTVSCKVGNAPWLGGAYATADKGITVLGQSGFPPKQPGCGGGQDAGAAPDRGTLDGGAPDQGRPPADTGGAPDSDAAAGDGSPGGCAVASRGEGWLLALLVALFWARRALPRPWLGS